MTKKILYFIICFFPVICLAQVPDFFQTDSTHKSVPQKPYIIITNDGGEFIGAIENINDREVTIVTKDKGRVIIPKYTIKKMEPVTEDNYKSGKYLNENSFLNRYFLTNNALPMIKGEMFVNTIYYTAASVDYNISDKFSVGLFTTLYGIPLIVNSKASFKIGRRLYFGPELHAGWVWASPKSFFTYGTMKITQGTSNNNFTFSGGYFFGNFDDLFWNSNFANYYFVNGSLAKRLNSRLAFIAEVWGFGNMNNNRMFPGALTVVGFKTLKKEKSSWTFSLVTLIFQERYTSYYNQTQTKTYIIPFPFIGWAIKI